MSDFSLPQLLEAIQTLYRGAPGADYTAMDRALKGFQKSQGAWSVVSQIFQLEGLDEAVYIFTAQTLKTKLSFDFEEIRNEALELFRTNLLSLLLRFKTQTKVLRQLCQCVGILALQTSSQWSPTMFSDLQAFYRSELGVLIPVLRSVAEESGNDIIVVDSDTRVRHNQFLCNSSHEVVEFLRAVSTGYEIERLECFLAWMQFGLDQQTILALPENPLLRLCFEALQRADLMTIATDALCEIISITEDVQRYESVVRVLLVSILQLTEPCRAALKDNNYALLQNFAKIFTTLGETHLQLILEQQEQTEVLSILSVLLDLMEIDDFEVLRNLNDFWNQFCKKYALYTPEAQRNTRKEFFRPYLMRLVPICLRPCKLSSSHMVQLNTKPMQEVISSETEDKRNLLPETVNDLTRLFGFQEVFGMLHSNLGQLLSGSFEMTLEERMSQIEVLVLFLSVLADSAYCDETNMLDEAIRALCIKGWSSIQIKNSVSRLVSQAAKHVSKALLPCVLDFLADCFTHPLSADSAARAFKDVCLLNKYDLIDYVPQLLLVFQATYNQPDSSQSEILEGVAWVVWRETTQIQANVTALCQPYALQLKTISDHIAQSSDSGELAACEKPLCSACDKLTIILKAALDISVDNAPVLYIFSQLWPLVKILLVQCGALADPVEKLCRIIKHAMRKVLEDFGQYLPELATLLTTGYQAYGHCSYLYIAENVARTFGKLPACKDLLSGLFDSLVGNTLALLSSLVDFTARSEVAEDFFGMMLRYLHYCPYVLVGPNSKLSAILNCAIAGIGVEHVEAGKCLYSFLERLVEYMDPSSPIYDAEVTATVKAHFPRIVKQMFIALVNVTPTALVESIFEALDRVVMMTEFRAWLQEALAAVPHDCLIQTEKRKFVEQVQDKGQLHFWIFSLHRRARQSALRSR